MQAWLEAFYSIYSGHRMDNMGKYESYEDAFQHKERKEHRRQRQISSFKDRSKFKKTDQDKIQKLKKETENEMAKKNLLRGRITGILSEGIKVSLEDGRELLCVLRGVLKKDNLRKKNLTAIGDFVLVEESGPHEGAIAHIEERTSVLSRAHTHHQQQEHIIAANIDQVLITLSIIIPPLKASLADRYIIATKKGNMDPILVVNKIDLLHNEPEHSSEEQLFRDFLDAYSQAGIPVIPVSSITGEGIEKLKEVMKDKASVFAGQSGVGKSSLINAATGLNLPVGEAIKKTKKGSHTTTSPHLIHLKEGGWCIDTPGIKSFGMWELSKQEVQEYYPEMRILREHCKFLNCMHIQEPGCAVVEKVHPIRYQSYLAIIESIEQEHLPR